MLCTSIYENQNISLKLGLTHPRILDQNELKICKYTVLKQHLKVNWPVNF